MRRLRRQVKTLIYTRWRTVGFICILTLLFIMHYHDKYTPSALLDLKSLTLTLDLPEGIQNEDTQVMLYNHQLKRQLKQEIHKDVDTSIYKERRNHLKNNCNVPGFKLPVVNKNKLREMWLIYDPPLFYCPVYKSGTTLWAKVLHVLRRNDPMIKSPFQMYENYGYQHYLTLNTRMAEDNTTFDPKKYLNFPMKFLFVRNPYSRIFSVYVDKVLAPNPYFWKFGADAIKKYRYSPVHQNPRDPKCGFDVTFQEFVKLVLEYKYQDNHVKPMHKLCHVCSIDYDVIGKLETFDKDVHHILKASGALGDRVQFKNFKLETNIDMILYQVIRAYMLEGEWRKCTDKHSALKRLWRQMQISGFIEKEHPFPFSIWESENITRTHFINIALEAFKESTSTAKDNKREAMLQAYSQLNVAELEGLRKMFLRDFQLFGYEDRPRELFEANKDFGKATFDYFDVMRE